MKTALQNKTLPILILLAVICGTIGCVNLETTAYRTIGATSVTVHQAMNAWGDYVRAGLASDSEQNKVRRAYENYQMVMRWAHATVINAKASPEPKEVYKMVLDSLDASRVELVGVVQAFIKKKP